MSPWVLFYANNRYFLGNKFRGNKTSEQAIGPSDRDHGKR